MPIVLHLNPHIYLSVKFFFLFFGIHQRCLHCQNFEIRSDFFLEKRILTLADNSDWQGWGGADDAQRN